MASTEKNKAKLTPLVALWLQKHKTISDFRRENEYDDHRKKQCEADPFAFPLPFDESGDAVFEVRRVG